MKKREILVGKVRLLVLISASFLAPLHAQVWHGDVCLDNIIAAAPDSRFTDNVDGTVTDIYTSLMWKRCTEGQSGADCLSGDATHNNWQQALQIAGMLNANGGHAGYSDWRLPNIKELGSLIEEACHSPAINHTYFPNTLSTNYWTSSPIAYNSIYAWNMHFHYGDSTTYPRDFSSAVRLVRSTK